MPKLREPENEVALHIVAHVPEGMPKPEFPDAKERQKQLIAEKLAAMKANRAVKVDKPRKS